MPLSERKMQISIPSPRFITSSGKSHSMRKSKLIPVTKTEDLPLEQKMGLIKSIISRSNIYEFNDLCPLNFVELLILLDREDNKPPRRK
jgi:hypothetical protein